MRRPPSTMASSFAPSALAKRKIKSIGRRDDMGATLCSNHSPMLDKFKEECGVFGILNHRDAANLVYLVLYALQHRGQESAGIASVAVDRTLSEGNIGEACGSDGTGERFVCRDTPQIHIEKEMGYVAEIFTQERLA